MSDVYIEYKDNGPDNLGRRSFVLRWWVEYTPSIPYPHRRQQHFFCVPSEVLKDSVVYYWRDA